MDSRTEYSESSSSVSSPRSRDGSKKKVKKDKSKSKSKQPKATKANGITLISELTEGVVVIKEDEADKYQQGASAKSGKNFDAITAFKKFFAYLARLAYIVLTYGVRKALSSCQDIYLSIKNWRPRKVTRALVRLAAMTGGGYLGAMQGALLGATLGSVIPGIGTAAGAVIGAIIGAYVGASFGAFVSKHAMRFISWVRNSGNEKVVSKTNPDKYRVEPAPDMDLEAGYMEGPTSCIDENTTRDMLRSLRQQKNERFGTEYPGSQRAREKREYNRAINFVATRELRVPGNNEAHVQQPKVIFKRGEASGIRFTWMHNSGVPAADGVSAKAAQGRWLVEEVSFSLQR